MTDLAASLLDSLAPVFGVIVEYGRGGETVTVEAVPRNAQYELVDSEGVAITHESRDYVVVASDLGLTPQPGDTITEADGQVYGVMSLGVAPCFTWSDPYHSVVKIHTKQIA